MDWDSEFEYLTSTLRPAIYKGVDSSISDVMRYAHSRAKSRSPVIHGILGNKALPEYCLYYVPDLGPSDVADIQDDLLAAGKQAVILTRCEAQWPVARCAGLDLPIVVSAKPGRRNDYGEFIDQMNGQVAHLRRDAAIDISMVDPTAALHLFANALIPFLGARLLAARLYPATELRNNVVVRNNEDGWNIVYRPSYRPNVQRALGGPGSPVQGLMPAGTFVFGITKDGLSAQWDTSTWSVPQYNRINVPLPPKGIARTSSP